MLNLKPYIIYHKEDPTINFKVFRKANISVLQRKLGNSNTNQGAPDHSHPS